MATKVNLENHLEEKLNNLIDAVSEEMQPDESSVDYIINDSVNLPIQEVSL
jgi:hypothetical protein